MIRVNLSLSDEYGNTVNIPLSPMQTKTVCKILMIEGDSADSVKMASDSTLRRFFEMKGNPLRLQSEPPYKGKEGAL